MSVVISVSHVSTEPLDGAETGVAKQSVNEADSSRRLVTGSPFGTPRILAGRDVLDPEVVTAVYANGATRTLFRIISYL